MECGASLSYEAWKAVGRHIRLYANASSWWLGDWLNFGEQRYGTRYRDGAALTGLGDKTLRNYAMVARRFDVSRRRDTLTFQHHAEVCALEDADQDFWLDIAAEHHWSKADLRRRLRAARTNGPHARRSMRTLPLHSDHSRRWEQAALLSGMPLELWMMKRLDEAADAALNPSS